MSIVAGATTAVAAALALVSLATPWTVVGGVMPAQSSTLAAGPVVSGALRVTAAFAVRRATPREAR